MRHAKKEAMQLTATAVLGLGRLVKSLARVRELVGLFDERVELFAALEDGLDGFDHDVFGVVQLLLDFGDGVGLLRVLVLDEVGWQGGEVDGRGGFPCCWVAGCFGRVGGPSRAWDELRVLVQ